ncbi:MAG: undecaprenyl/decaprenyl-phosphate alpha-N-acetylglucosaminyl 1-phosphate transferase [Persephonella sp.]|nr:MAG: undecaprenyl/decaprenyl-phosphate alpha-N-acetylglucosaminyl 1-phosphate transferase [Persephonella sp.]
MKLGYIYFAFLAFFISFIIQLIIINISKRKNIFIDRVDINKPQKFHTVPTPRAGGIGIFFANLILLINPLGLKFFIASFFAFFSGILEDLHQNISPKIRLLLQLLAGIIAVYLIGAFVKDIGFIKFPYLIGILFTIFAIVGGINAINIIDGFNGLASGVSLLILTAFGIVAYIHQDYDVVFIILINIFTILGFLIFNFPFGKIFLGDSGAYFLGFVISEVAVLLPYRHPDISPWFSLAVIIYPVWEALFSSYRRKIRKYSPLQPDKLHLHSLIKKRITRNNPKTSFLIWILIIPFVFLPVFYYDSNILCFITVILFVVMYNFLYKYITKFRLKIN